MRHTTTAAVLTRKSPGPPRFALDVRQGAAWGAFPEESVVTLITSRTLAIGLAFGEGTSIHREALSNLPDSQPKPMPKAELSG